MSMEEFYFAGLPAVADRVYSYRMKCCFLICCLLTISKVNAQTLGGNSIFNFLKLSNTPQLTGLGGENISNLTNDIGLSFQNPSLLRQNMHSTASFVFSSLYGEANNFHLLTGYTHHPSATNFSFGVNYFDYGSVTATDPSGNQLGEIDPAEYVVQVSASRAYGSKWNYGVTLKYIKSDYGTFRSAGVALDVAAAYRDSSQGLQASLVVSNMGTQLTTFTGAGKEELPFNLQVGVSKRLQNAPIQFSLTASRLHRLDVTYNDSVFNADNNLDGPGKKFIIDNMLRHIVLATQFYISDRLEISAGYNYLRRKELNIGASGNGLNGFSMGAGVLFRKIQLRYARAYYQSNHAYHQFGINLRWEKFL